MAVDMIARRVCLVLGGFVVLLCGVPVVMSLWNGVVPYDLSGLTVGTLGMRWRETLPLILLGLGVAALILGLNRASWVLVGVAVVLVVLIFGAIVGLEDGGAGLLIFRLVVVGGGSIFLASVMAVAVIAAPGRHASAVETRRAGT